MMELRFSPDSRGFPMVWMEPLGGYVHWLPVTKVHFERFLCSTTDIDFDDRWYDAVMAMNPRESAKDLTVEHYWRAFITGLLPGEVESYARWCGPGYRVPTKDEWLDLYDYCVEQDLQKIDWGGVLELSARDRELLEQMERIFHETRGERSTLADQMYLRFGVLEWVKLAGGRLSWGGLGQLSPNFYGILTKPEQRSPFQPRNPTERFFYCGFRLLKVGS